MKVLSIWATALFLSACQFCVSSAGSNHGKSKNPSPSPLLSTDPGDLFGVQIKDSQWIEIEQSSPANTELKRKIAPPLSFGILPAYAVVQFDSDHADVQVSTHHPVICVCNLPGIKEMPLLVRLHTIAGYRELRGQAVRLGAQFVKPNKSDLIPVEVVTKKPNVWLLRPRSPLPAGEYAVVFPSINMALFPFGVTDAVLKGRPLATKD